MGLSLPKPTRAEEFAWITQKFYKQQLKEWDIEVLPKCCRQKNGSSATEIVQPSHVSW